jgi:class 3 adenylate cyclase
VDLDESTGLRIDVSPGSIEARPVPSGDNADERVVELVSRLDQPVVVLVERAGAATDAVFGATLATYPEFLDLFATEAPASGVELTIAHMALLFSDLTGSTALYSRVGDAKAFGVVQEHFRSMGASVSQHGGAIVKTMGDAVMATFASELDAVDAAVDMLKRCHQEHASLGLSAKLGVHAGPCLAVRANERLDFFGTTVNVAARLQAQAHGGELVLDQELAARPEVAARLEALPQRRFSAALRGLEGDRRLVGFHAVGEARDKRLT